MLTFQSHCWENPWFRVDFSDGFKTSDLSFLQIRHHKGAGGSAGLDRFSERPPNYIYKTCGRTDGQLGKNAKVPVRKWEGGKEEGEDG